MKYLIIIFGLLLLLPLLNAQETSKPVQLQIQRKNAIYAQNFIIFPVIYYDRVIPIEENFGFTPRLGLGFYDTSPVPIFGISFYIGKNKHFGELGTAYWAFEGLLINANYRFVSKKGFLFKVGFEYIPGEEGAPIIGLGYAF